MNSIFEDKHQFIENLLEGLRGPQDSPTPLEHGDTAWMGDIYTGVIPQEQAQPKRDFKYGNPVEPDQRPTFAQSNPVTDEKSFQDLVQLFEDYEIEDPIEKARELLQKILRGW